MNSQDDPTGSPAASDERALPPAVAAVGATVSVDNVLQQFARDYIRDRRSERRWRVFFRIVWLLVLCMFLWSVISARRAAAVPAGAHTALIELRGEIAVDMEASAENMVTALKAAFEDAGARAIVLRINSPGGSPVQAGIINDEIRRLKALHNKKVYAVVEEVCASGAYYIAAAADEIYTDKASIVGSIGVLMDSFGFVGTMEKLGIERRLYTAGENKGMNDPFSPQNEKQRAFTQSMLDQIHRQFIQAVKDGRGKRLKQSPEIFSGLYWNGEEAVRLGLVDRLGNLDYVAREVVRAEEIVDYTPKENIAERLVKRFGTSVGAGAVSALRSVAGVH